MEHHPRLVVTGGRGQLGRALGARVPEAVLLDIDELDLTDTDAVVRTLCDLGPETIIHGGAYTAVDAAESDPEGARAVNAGGTRAVAEAAAALRARLVYISTDYVFGGTLRRPYPEDHPTAPLSVYGATKLEGEQVTAAVEDHLIVRTSWVFGEGKNFIAAILGAARTRAELSVVDDQWGRPTYAVDLAGGILDLLDRGATGTFHLQGGGEPGTWADVAEAALAAAGSATRVTRVTTAEYDAGRTGPTAPRPPYSVLDCSKAAGLGVALRPWREAMEEYVKVTA
ncbi:MAG TPA: dTDP-4-dehydrorhamnose reductase [Actinomycetota bacterium]